MSTFITCFFTLQIEIEQKERLLVSKKHKIKYKLQKVHFTANSPQIIEDGQTR